MPLNRTTILNGKSDEITSRKGKFVMLVILGAHNKELAKLADGRANDDKPPRHVLWADSERGIEDLTEDIEELELDNSRPLLQMLKKQPEKVLGFAISLGGKVADIITDTERIDRMRVDKAFKKAISA